MRNFGHISMVIRKHYCPRGIQISDPSIRFFSKKIDTAKQPLSEGRSSARGFRYGITAGIGMLGGIVALRAVYGQILEKETNQTRGAPKRDTSKATVLLKQTPRISSDNHGKTPKMGKKLHRVGATALNDFLDQRRQILAEAKLHSKNEAMDALSTSLGEAMSDCSKRAGAFADWYFAYPTNWKLLSLALSAAASHAVKIRKETSLKERVSEDLQAFVCEKYDAIVLRPAQTDPKIHRAMTTSVKVAHGIYLATLIDLQEALDSFLEAESQLHPTYSLPPTPNDVVLEIDWAAQLQKMKHVPISYDKSPTVALVGAGVVAGKLGGGAATKALFSKLTTPFAAKAVGTTLSGGAASGAGAVVAGPVGAAMGAAVGVGIDMTVNAGVALMQRSSFEAEVQDSLEAAQIEWKERLAPELDRVQDIWFGSLESDLKTMLNRDSDK